MNSNKNQNLIRARNLIKVAAEQGARLVVLPVSLIVYVIFGNVS